jgi:hypothetical protein
MKVIWRRICALYVLACRHLRKDRLTLSAWAWKHYRETGDSWARNRIDGLALLVAGQRDHCASQYARETDPLTKQ